MAPRIKAVNAFRPRIEQGNTVQKPEFVRAVSRATSLVEGTVDQAIKETRDQIVEFCRAGRADSAMNAGINLQGTFSGTILNRENIGKTSDELVALWNEEHADDPVSLTD